MLLCFPLQARGKEKLRERGACFLKKSSRIVDFWSSNKFHVPKEHVDHFRTGSTILKGLSYVDLSPHRHFLCFDHVLQKSAWQPGIGRRTVKLLGRFRGWGGGHSEALTPGPPGVCARHQLLHCIAFGGLLTVNVLNLSVNRDHFESIGTKTASRDWLQWACDMCTESRNVTKQRTVYSDRLNKQRRRTELCFSDSPTFRTSGTQDVKWHRRQPFKW